jgi:hypothetical protein
VATERLETFRMIQKTNVAYLELYTYLKREIVKVFFPNDLGDLLFVSAAGCHCAFENGYTYNTSLCILHVAKTVTLTAVELSFHKLVHME